MIKSPSPLSDQTMLADDESMVFAVSAGSAPIEHRIADEMSITLQGWLRGLPTRSARHRKGKGRT